MTQPSSEFPADDVRSYFDHPVAWAQVSKGLQRIAMAIVGDERDAEDVVQGAWLEALSQAKYRQSQGWMRRLVRFRALDVLRRRRQEPFVTVEELPAEPCAESADIRWKLEAQSEVLDAVRPLKEPYLSTVVLRYFEGKGPKEIAKHQGVPERTVKTRLTRAHAILREHLHARYRDESGNWAPALLLFAGIGGPKVIPAIVPVVAIAGIASMKKIAIIAAVVALAWVVSYAILGEPGVDLEQSSVALRSTAIPPLEATAGVAQSAMTPRAAVADGLQDPEVSEAALVYAFPQKPAAEVGSLGIRVRWTDGSPADHLKIGIMPMDAADAFLMGRTVYTDSAGLVKIDQLAPGRVKVIFSRIGVDEVTIIAGQHTEIEKRAPQGELIRGRVIDPSGRPVAGALIFVADSRGGDNLPEANAHTDGRGRFELKSVFDHSYVSARAAGFSPSIPIETGVSTGQPRKLDLILRGNPAMLRGLVLSPSGDPVVGAKIRIELPLVTLEAERDSEAGIGWRAVSTKRSGSPLPFFLRTDTAGRFESDQIGSGSMRILARTATWQPWIGAFDLAVGETKEITIRFATGVQLSGHVKRENGDPIPKALLIAGGGANLDSYRVQTNEDGRYHINGLAPGPFDLRVFRSGFEGLKRQVILRTDAPNQIDFTLRKLQSVRGVVNNEAGDPLFRWLVAVEGAKTVFAASAWTDRQGKFELKGIPDGSTDLIVTREDFWKSATRMVLPSALPTESPLRIVVPDSVIPNSSVRMMLLVDGLPAPLETRIRLRSASPLTHRDVHPQADGSLVLDKLASQAFRLEVDLDGYAKVSQRFQLGVTEDLNLGTIHLVRGGRVRVRVQGLRSTREGSCQVLDDRGRVLQSFDLEKGQGISSPIPSGAVMLRYNEASGATQFAEVEVRTGETTDLRLVRRAGTGRQILISRKNGAQLRFRTIAEVTDTRGHIHFYSHDLLSQHGVDGAVSIALSGLELGAYRLRLEDPSGKVNESWLRVTTLDESMESAEPIVLDW